MQRPSFPPLRVRGGKEGVTLNVFFFLYITPRSPLTLRGRMTGNLKLKSILKNSNLYKEGENNEK
jgi:hypothetical protein